MDISILGIAFQASVRRTLHSAVSATSQHVNCIDFATNMIWTERKRYFPITKKL